MKKFLVCTLLSLAGSVVFTSCETTVPRTPANRTTVETTQSYSK